MFPDLDSDTPGGAVGILIPETVTTTEREIFESLLTEMTTAFKTQVGVVEGVGNGGERCLYQEEVEAEYAEYREFSSTLAQGLVKGITHCVPHDTHSVCSA